MIHFEATIKKFGSKGEKSGWTYIDIPADIASQLKPGNKKEFKVKGKLDKYAFKRISLLPMGGGPFIMALNATIRKAIGKRHGAMVTVQLTADDSSFIFNKDFLDCLNDDPVASVFFKSLTGSHQRYISKWIEAAKTEPTRVKRIANAVNALSKKMGFREMLRAGKDLKL